MTRPESSTLCLHGYSNWELWLHTPLIGGWAGHTSWVWGELANDGKQGIDGLPSRARYPSHSGVYSRHIVAWLRSSVTL